MKRVTIIGANSALAKNLIDLTLEKYQFTLISRRHVAPSINARMILTDYQNLKDYKEIIQSSEYILYCIGVTNSTDEEIKKININIFDNISKYISKKTKFIFISSASVIHNNNSYSRSKRDIEEKLKKMDIEYISLRPTLMYGPYDKKNLIKIVQIMKFLPFIPVIGSTEKVQPVYMKDIAKLIEKIIDNNIFNKKNYVTAGLRQVKLLELYKALALKNKINKVFVLIPLKPVQLILKTFSTLCPFRIPLTYQITNMKTHPIFDNTPAIQELGYAPTAFEKGIFEF